MHQRGGVQSSGRGGAGRPTATGRNAGNGYPATTADTGSPAVHNMPRQHVAPGARNDPTLVVVFISTPGLGKTAICEALARSLDPGKYHVVHHHSDAQAVPQRKRFWPAVNSLALTRRGDGRTTVVLADKNLIDSPVGNWDKTAATITAPVLAVLLTDEATAASLNPGPRPVDENTAPAPSVSSSTRMSPPVAAPANSAAAAAAAARTAAEAIGLRKVSSQGSAEVAAPAPASPGVPVPFSMEQLALAMLRVFQRSDHVGGLDSRLDKVLQIMCGFAGTFRDLPPADAVSHLKSAFHNVHVLPVCTARSSAPVPSPDDHRDLMRLVCEGFRKGKFGGKGGRGSGIPATWEARTRSMLGRDDMAAFLAGYARPLDTIVGDLAAAVERTAAAEAALKAPAATGTPGAVQASNGAPRPVADVRAAMPSHVAEAKLRRCAYVGVGGFSRTAVAGAFAEAQSGAAGSDGGMHEAKSELHITLWHRAEGPQERGLACVGAEGAPVQFLVTGFDVSPTLSAARVEFPEQGTTGRLDGGVLDVELPHITMHVGAGEKAMNARWLKRRQEAGEAGVRWLPLPEPLRLSGKVQIVAKQR